MESQELVKKAKELVEGKRKIIQTNTELFLQTGGKYSEEDNKTLEKLAEESRQIAVARLKLLKQAHDEVNAEAIFILEIQYFSAIKEETEKSRDSIEKFLNENR